MSNENQTPEQGGTTKTFTMTTIGEMGNLVANWHRTQLDYGDRLLDIPEGTEIEVVDAAAPDSLVAIPLTGPTLQAFRVGVLSVLNLFKQLPFAVTPVPEAANDDDKPTQG